MTRFDQAMLAAVCVALLFWPRPRWRKARNWRPAASPASKKAHRLVLQVNSNEPGTMKFALNNATNVEQHYRERGEKIEIEIVTFGPGLHMLRDDTSPVKDRIKAIAERVRRSRSRPAANPGKHGQGREQGDPAVARHPGEVGRGAAHGAAGARLDVHPAIEPAVAPPQKPSFRGGCISSRAQGPRGLARPSGAEPPPWCRLGVGKLRKAGGRRAAYSASRAL